MRNAEILEILALTSCSHHFSWPRRASEGEYYQVCVLCGDQYDYDWNSMRRLRRRPLQPAGKDATAQKRATAWYPRARRIPLAGLVRHLELGTDMWIEGELKNISNSGVLFAGSGLLPKGTRIQIELEMPSEICGGSTRRCVMCDAQVMRTEGNVCAAQIFDYVFV